MSYFYDDCSPQIERPLLIHSLPRSPYAVHTHPPQDGNPPQGAPGALPPDAPGNMDAVPVSQLNEDYMQKRQGYHDRLEADSRGYDSVFSQ